MPPPDPPPISAELWARLRRFDPHCSISMQRTNPYLVTWKHMRRVWLVSIHHEREKAWDYVKIEHPRLADALRLAVEAAEKRGWAG